MPANVRHHFVPQFYLRNFAIGEQLRQIGLFNIPTQLYVPRTSIRSQAQRARLYGVHGGEEALCQLEGAAAEVIRRAVERDEVPKRFGGDHLVLLTFVLFQAFRTPSAGAELEQFVEQLVKKIASFDAKMAPHVDKFRVCLNDPVQQSLGYAALHHPFAMDLAYKLLINRSGTPFITSDHPVIFYNQFMERRAKIGSATGLACKGLQAILPLGPRCCLIMYDDDVYRVGGRSLKGVQVAVTEGEVRFLNAMQVSNAQNQLFFGDSISEAEIRRTVAVGVPWRPSNRSTVKSYPGEGTADGLQSVLLHSSKTDLRVGLKLGSVEELPSARSYSLGNRVVHTRDPVLCQLHEEFVKKVNAGEYRGSEFGKFMRERRTGLKDNAY